MWDRYIREYRIALERILIQEGNNIYWWVLLDRPMLVVFVRGHKMDIKLPLPTVLGKSKWHDEWKYKERNEAEIARCSNIWSSLVNQLQEKLARIDRGESTMEAEFKDGILFEDGQWGLKYERSWKL